MAGNQIERTARLSTQAACRQIGHEEVEAREPGMARLRLARHRDGTRAEIHPDDFRARKSVAKRERFAPRAAACHQDASRRAHAADGPQPVCWGGQMTPRVPLQRLYTGIRALLVDAADARGVGVGSVHEDAG